MSKPIARRSALGAGGAALAAGVLTAGATAAADATAADASPKKIKILAICGSPRKGKTTSAGLRIALESAKAVAPDRIDVELIELGGRRIDGSVAAGIAPEPGQRDDFPPLLPKITAADVAGIIVGSPVYFGDMSSLLKAFFERCSSLRSSFGWSNKVGGVLAVASARNGGQEQTIRSIQMVMFGQEMILVGDGRPTAPSGATLWTNGKDDISGDAPGVATAKNLGRRVAEVALRVHGR